MYTLDKIVVSKYQPNQTNVIWVDTSEHHKVIKVYDGTWQEAKSIPQDIVDDIMKKAAAHTGYGQSSTAAATAAKTVSIDGYELTKGGSIKVKFDNANSASNPTLNISGTGAKPLYYKGNPASSTNTWSAGETVDIYYDGTNYQANTTSSIDQPEVQGTTGQVLQINAQGKPEWVTPSAGTTPDSAMSDSSTNAIQNKVVKAYVDDLADEVHNDYAKQDGYYDLLHAGEARNIEGTTPVEAVFTDRTAGGTVDIATGLSSIDSIKGNSVAWNQLIQNGDFADTTGWTIENALFSVSEGIASVTATTAYSWIYRYISLIPTHKYLYKSFAKLSEESNSISIFLYDIVNASTIYKLDISSTTNFVEHSCIFTAAANANNMVLQLGRDTSSSNWVTSYHKNIQLIDLTLLGIDNLTTVAEVEDWLSKNVGLRDYYPYNAGQLIDCKVQGIKTVGFNQWDEEWESGSINPNTGENTINASKIRSKNYIPVFPNTSYYFNLKPCNDSCHIIYYNYNKKAISYTSITANYDWGEHTTPTNCYYIRFNYFATSYNHDICINLSWSGTKNGEYQPYWTETKPFDVTKVYGKLDGEGSLVQVFAGGMRKAGDVRDALYVENGVTKAKVNVGSVDLGETDWAIPVNYNGLPRTYSLINGSVGYMHKSSFICKNYVYSDNVTDSNTATNKTAKLYTNSYLFIVDDAFDGKTGQQVKTAMSGVYLNYELATPLTYTDLVYREDNVDTPFSLPINFRVDDWGKESQVFPAPVSNEITSCAAELSLVYGVNAADFIKNSGKNFISIDRTPTGTTGSFDQFLSALGTAMGGTWTKTWSEQNNRWEFSFVQSAQSNEP